MKLIVLKAIHIGLPIGNQTLYVNAVLASLLRISTLLDPHASPSLSWVLKSKPHPARNPILLAMAATLRGPKAC